MRFIVAGLGYFGTAISENLTSQGHEVIGIDSRINKVELIKDNITHSICMDTTDEHIVGGLPVKDTDMVIVAIGEDQGKNILTTAVFKNLGAKYIVCRALNKLHEQILKAIGANDIIRPEEEAAKKWSKKLTFKNICNSFELNKHFSIIETIAPKNLFNKSLEELNFREEYNIMVLTKIKQTQKKSLIGEKTNVPYVEGLASANMIINQGDTLVLYGANVDLERFLKKNK